MPDPVQAKVLALRTVNQVVCGLLACSHFAGEAHSFAKVCPVKDGTRPVRRPVLLSPSESPSVLVCFFLHTKRIPVTVERRIGLVDGHFALVQIHSSLSLERSV